MKKYLLVIAIAVCQLANANFINQLVFIRSFTPSQIDSIFQDQGIPQGIFPITYGGKAYKIIYNTVSWDSTATIASGLVIVPQGVGCKVPIISYQHGTVLEKAGVPSRLRSEWFIGLAAAANGIMAVLPDYMGMGDGPGLHPYQNAHTEATAVIDMIRAAKEGADSMGAAVNDQLFLMGYSQGGHATMAAHQLIQQQLDNEMHVTAAAPMSGAYDMSGAMVDVMLSDSTYPNPFYLPYLFFGNNQIYNIYSNPSDVLVAPYDTLLPPLFNGQYSASYVDNVMPQVPKLILHPFHIDSFANGDSTHFFRKVLRANDTYRWVPTSPIRMYFCRGDRQVSYKNSVTAYNYFKQVGATAVDTVLISPTLDHYACAQFAILQGTQWLQSFAYKPLGSAVTTVKASNWSATDGSITATGVEGNAGYKYLWSTGDTTATVSNLGVGVYYVTITDENLCTKVDSAFISTVTGIDDFVMSNVRVYPNPAKDVVNIQWLNSDETFAGARLIDVAGQEITTYKMQDGNNIQILVGDHADGVYYLHIKSAAGKEMRQKVVLMQ